MTPLIRNTLILSGIWILITIVSWILPGCVTAPTDIDQRLARMEYLLDSTIYITEGTFCEINYDICMLKNFTTCWKQLENCEIQANKRFKQTQERK
jgi:hypothetical protein